MMVSQALGLPRRQRDMLERSLTKKRELEDATRQARVEGKPTVEVGQP